MLCARSSTCCRAASRSTDPPRLSNGGLADVVASAYRLEIVLIAERPSEPRLEQRCLAEAGLGIEDHKPMRPDEVEQGLAVSRPPANTNRDNSSSANGCPPG